MCDPARVDLATLVARAVDRALAQCREDDPPRVVALRVGWAVLGELGRAGITRRGGGGAPRALSSASNG